MKKVLVVLFALMCVVGTANAQQIKLSVGPEVALPMGAFGDAANIGFGGTVRAEYPVAPNMNLMLTAGYLMWGGKEFDFGFFKVTTDYSAIPILAGAKYFFAPGIYGMAEAGIHMFTFKAETTGGLFAGSSSTSESKFGGGVGVGYEAALSPTVGLDLNAKYAFVSGDLSYIGARVGVKFGL